MPQLAHRLPVIPSPRLVQSCLPAAHTMCTAITAIREDATDHVGVYAGFVGVAALVTGFAGAAMVFSAITGTA